MRQRYFENSIQHILAELERIDLLIRVQVLNARHIYHTDSQFQGLYVSEQEVDALLANADGMPRWVSEAGPVSAVKVQEAMARITEVVECKKMENARLGIPLPLEEIIRLYDLSPFERDVILICLAPELDLRYERLYAYLQDDVTKKRPSVDLVLNLLSPSVEAKLAGRSYFSADAPLLKHYLLNLFEEPSHQQPPLLAKYLKVDERVVNYLHGLQEIDGRIRPFSSTTSPRVRFEELVIPANVKKCLIQMVRHLKEASGNRDEREPVIFLTGTYGVGKQATAEALCSELGRKLLLVDGEFLLRAEKASVEKMVHVAQREALLQGAALYWTGFDLLLADDKKSLLRTFLRSLEDYPNLTFLEGGTTWEPLDALQRGPFMRIELPLPAYAERVELWKRFMDGDTLQGDLRAVATKFRLSGGQIRDAAASARNLARWRHPNNGHVTISDLYAACRLQSNRKLTDLAQKITPHCTWEDLVLPADRRQQLREICNYVKYRSLVYDEWGFDRKLSLGKGLNILFVGPSGTGKTMAAEIMASELGLDLYKIDLSTVVSKYIGETEKNLTRIFAEAETSNAILFFDEADALFGKRSEVRDSHDRYANIEISYLLQKMEEYDGIVILATNLRKNMDDAFVRRMHFTVEFPFPGEADRRRIWVNIWPAETPRSPELDLGDMARRFELAGGNIRNVALAAAFLAADDGRVVDMPHLLRATQREYQKMGKVVSEREFEVEHENS